jgi:hypothetical protein
VFFLGVHVDLFRLSELCLTRDNGGCTLQLGRVFVLRRDRRHNTYGDSASVNIARWLSR